MNQGDNSQLPLHAHPPSGRGYGSSRGLPPFPLPHPGLPECASRACRGHSARQKPSCPAAQLPVLPEGPLLPGASTGVSQGPWLSPGASSDVPTRPPPPPRPCRPWEDLAGAQALLSASFSARGPKRAGGKEGHSCPLRGPPVQSEAGAPQGPSQTLPGPQPATCSDTADSNSCPRPVSP